jgi:hypothetical protein
VLGQDPLGELDRVLGDLAPVVHPRVDLVRGRRPGEDLPVEVVPGGGLGLAALQLLGVVVGAESIQ